jgi:hypothetical protein
MTDATHTTIKDANSNPKDLPDPNPNGRAAATGSRPVALSNEDKAALDAIAALLTTQATYLDGVESGLAAVLAKLIAAPATEAKQDTANTALAALMYRAAPIVSSATVTRPATTPTYDSTHNTFGDTTTPAGGGTLANINRGAGKTSRLEDVLIVSSNGAATALQGELFIFNAAPTSPADNTLFTLTKADHLKLITRIPFALSPVGASASAAILNINKLCKPAAGQDLRFLVKVSNAYVGVASETLDIIATFTPED